MSTTLLYDKHCSLCSLQVRIISWLDLFHLIRLIPYQDPQATLLTADLKPSQLHAAIHCISTDKKIRSGAYALRHIALHLLPTAPLALMLYLPGAMLIAEAAYTRLSRNRQRISQALGCKHACAIIPPRQRSGDIIDR